MCPDIPLLHVLRNTFHYESFPKLASLESAGRKWRPDGSKLSGKIPSDQQRSSQGWIPETHRQTPPGSPRTLVYSWTNVSGFSFGTNGGRSQEEESSLVNGTHGNRMCQTLPIHSPSSWTHLSRVRLCIINLCRTSENWDCVWSTRGCTRYAPVCLWRSCLIHWRRLFV